MGLIAFMPVHAQGIFYCSPAPIEITGPAAYVPGFQFIVTFSQPSGTSILTELTRKFNYTAEEGLRPLGDFYKTVGFQTDSVNEYILRIKANYSQPVNQTIQYSIVSAGEAAGSHDFWCISSQVELIFHITTTKNPTSAEAIAEALDQRQIARDLLAQKRQDETNANDAAILNRVNQVFVVVAVAAAASIYLFVKDLRRRSPIYG